MHPSIAWVLAPACLLPWAHPARAQVIGSFFDPIPITVGGAPGDASASTTAGLYEAPGLDVDGLRVRPNLTSSLGYDSNVVATRNASGSTVIDTRLTTDIRTDRSRDNVFLSADADDRRTLDLPRQSFTEWSVQAGGTFDVGSDALSASYTHLNLFEQPGALNAVTTAEPVPFRLDTGTASYALNGFGRFSFVPQLTITNYDFSDFAAGGQSFSQAYRNRLATQGDLVTHYELAPHRDVLLVVRGVHLSYSFGTAAAPRRDSNGGAVLSGLDYPTPASNFRFRVLAGVQVRQYVSRAYANQLDPIVEASVVWTPTRLTTVNLLARRDIEDAQDENIASYIASSVRVGVAHELLRNVRLGGYVEFQHAAYQSATIRTSLPTQNEVGNSDTVVRTGTDATWLLDRNVRAVANYGFSRGSGNGGSKYVASVVSLGLNFQW